MNLRRIILPVFAAVLIMSCSGLKKNSRGHEETVVIRYINMRALYSYLLKNDERADRLKKKRESITEEIEQDKLRILSGNNNSDEVYKKINKNREKLKSLNEDEEKHKSYLLNKINIAVKKAAKSAGCDFVLNMGDEVVFGKKKYDITEEVLRELELIEKRSDPVSR